MVCGRGHGDTKAGPQCAEGDTEGWGTEAPLCRVREGGEVALWQSARAGKAAGTCNINKSFNEKYICCSAASWPEVQVCFWFSDGCCRTFYFTIVETKLESIFNPFPLAAFPCHPADVLILLKLSQGLGEAKGRAGCTGSQQEDNPSLDGPFALRPGPRLSCSGLLCKETKSHGWLPFSSFSFSRREDFFFFSPACQIWGRLGRISSAWISNCLMAIVPGGRGKGWVMTVCSLLVLFMLRFLSDSQGS